MQLLFQLMDILIFLQAYQSLNYEFLTQKSIALLGSSPGLGPTGTFTLGVSKLGGNITSYDRVTFAHLTGKMLGLQFYEDSATECEIYEYSVYGKLKGFRGS